MTDHEYRITSGQINSEPVADNAEDQFRSRSSSLNISSLPIRLAVDLSNAHGTSERRASQLVIDQRGLTLKFASSQSSFTNNINQINSNHNSTSNNIGVGNGNSVVSTNSTNTNVINHNHGGLQANAHLTTRSNSVMVLPTASSSSASCAHAPLVTSCSSVSAPNDMIKSDNMIDSTMDAQQARISLTLTQDGELSVCPDGGATPFVQLKISPRFLMPSPLVRSRQNSVCSDQPSSPQPMAHLSPSLSHAHPSSVNTINDPTNFSNFVVDFPKMFAFPNNNSSVDSCAANAATVTGATSAAITSGSMHPSQHLSKMYMNSSHQFSKEQHIWSTSTHATHNTATACATGVGGGGGGGGIGGGGGGGITVGLSNTGICNNGDNHYKSSPKVSFDTIINQDPLLLAKLKQKHAQREQRQTNERLTQVLGEMIMPFLLAGLGNVATGWLLFNVQTWPVFLNVPQLIILIPALLGLKGNVEMTLASRMSTHSNLGDLDRPVHRRQLISGNLALVQCQSSTVGFLAPLIALAISYINPDEDDILTFNEAILLMASSVITANIANLILSVVMFSVIFVCRQMDVNPDNVATPIAASLGDFLTMSLLAYTARTLFVHMDKPFIQATLLILLLLLTPVWAYAARRNKFTKSLVFIGFAPICGAMMLQITGGLIMEHALSQFKKLAPLQPVVNGVGGNLVAIQCSRMATYLHRTSRLRTLPPSDHSWLIPPWRVFTSAKSAHSAMARLLLCLPVPAHLLFLMVIKLIRDSFMFTGAFLFVYSITAWLQVALLIHLGYTLTHFLWKRGVNPDNWAIPFMTAFADLIGSAMLAIAFIVLFELKDENAIFSVSAPIDRSSLTAGQLLLASGTTPAPLLSFPPSSSLSRFQLHHSHATPFVPINSTDISANLSSVVSWISSPWNQTLNPVTTSIAPVLINSTSPAI